MKRMIPFARGLSLPPEAVTETFALIGRRGSGKTHAAHKLNEGMLDIGAQTVGLDGVGNWYGLRVGPHAFNIPVLGGAHGDIPLEHTAGALIADLIVDKQISAIIDVSSFSKSKRKVFVAQFAERLFHRKKTNRSPMHFFIEEAQMFAPQRADRGAEAMLGAIEDIVRLGRNYGIGATLISQRPQSVNKEVLNQIEALVCFQVNGAHERKAIRDWIVHQGIDVAEMAAQLPSLPVGSAFFWSPQWLETLRKIKVLKKRTADTSATPRVSRRNKKFVAKSLGKRDLTALKAAMAETVDKVKESDPKELRRRIAQLERQLSSVKEAAVATEPEIVEVPTLSEADQESMLADLMNVQSTIVELQSVVETVSDATKSLQMSVDRCKEAVLIGAAERVRRVPRREQVTPAPQRPRPTPPPSNGDLPDLRKGAHRMLGCLAAFYPGTMTKRQVAGAAKMKSTGGTFNTYWSELRKHELIQEKKGRRWQITAAGFALLGDDAPPIPKGAEERVRYWRKRLRKGAVRILDELHRSWLNRTGPIDKESLASRVEMAPTGGTFNTYLSILTANGIVEKGPDGYCLSDWILGAGS